jgi:hypothetical protein
MRKWYLSAVTVFLLSSLANATEEGRELPITYHRQHTKVWCWAASIAMVVDYFQNHPVSDCVVLTEFSLRRGKEISCCANPSACTKAGKLEDMTEMMSRTYGIHGDMIDRSLSYNEIVREIDADRPIIAAIDKKDEGGHIVVISGYVFPNRVVVLDPERGRLVRVLEELIRSTDVYEGWAHTFLFSSRRSNEPMCRDFDELVVSPEMPP